MNSTESNLYDANEHSYKHILDSLQSLKDIVYENKMDVNIVNNFNDEPQGILIVDTKNNTISEHHLFDLIKFEYDFENGNFEDFRQEIGKRTLNHDIINKQVEEINVSFYNHEIKSFKIENVLYNLEGELVYLEVIFTHLDDDKFIITVENISNSVQDKLLLEQLAINNHILIKEVHHRVKNNLQILLSLIRIQESFKINNDEIIEYLKLSVSSMALLHNQLQTENLDYIKFKELITDFKSNIDNLYFNENIEFNFNCYADFKAPIDKANPIFLILNELLINSIKHGFDDENSEKIISCEFRIDNKDLIIDYNDNGKSISELDQGTHLGEIIIDSLVKQVDGSHEIFDGDGFHIKITIPMIQEAL